MTDTTDSPTVEKLASGTPMGVVARIGLGARAVIYLTMGLLAISVARGASRTSVDQRGAIRTILHQPLGTFLVVLLAVGFAAYALWRLSEVFFGPDGEKDTVATRAKSLVRAVAYGFFAVGAVAILLGDKESQTKQQQDAASTALHLPGGQVVLGLVGAAFVLAGAVMVWEGWTRKFLSYFDYLPPVRRRIVVWLGRIGTIARGLVFALAGVLVVIAAWTADADSAGGINDAVHVALRWPLGGGIVTVMGVGLLIFGAYGVTEALWRHVPEDNS